MKSASTCVQILISTHFLFGSSGLKSACLHMLISIHSLFVFCSFDLGVATWFESLEINHWQCYQYGFLSLSDCWIVSLPTQFRVLLIFFVSTSVELTQRLFIFTNWHRHIRYRYSSFKILKTIVLLTICQIQIMNQTVME